MHISMGSKFIPTLSEVESEVIDVDEIDEGGREAFLVGRLVTEKVWNPSNLIEEITEAWKMTHGGMSSKEWGDSKLILFHFDDVMDRDWVLKNQPWHFKGSLFAIKEFTGGNEQQLSSLDNVTIEHTSFWARLYDVPISCMNERSLRIFAKQMGILESVDKADEDSIGRFLRFKISVNITKPLLRGITIRAKGKHLWLPLKYESLPNYCFCCGTIGHDRENCQSSNRNLEYSACTLSASIWKRRKTIQRSLPLDIIENILSRVPVKYLLRFKAVSKQWKALISDPRFAEIHLQQYKKSSSQNLLLHDYRDFYVAKFQNHRFEFVSTLIKYSPEYRFTYGVGAYCDGLYITHRNPLDDDYTYVLWNASCRYYKEVLFQPMRYNSPETITGIYYNPMMKDYKLVMADRKQYAVFSCRYNKWSKVERMEYYSCSDNIWSGVHFDGSFYWLITREKEKEPYLSPPRGLVGYFSSSGIVSETEILCFDWRDENFKKLPVPYCEGVTNWLCVSSSGGHLCLFGKDWSGEMFILKKVNCDEKHSCMKFKMPFAFGGWDVFYPLWVSENEFILEACLDEEDDEYYLLFDLSKNTCLEIRDVESRQVVCPIPYLENLFLQ